MTIKDKGTIIGTIKNGPIKEIIKTIIVVPFWLVFSIICIAGLVLFPVYWIFWRPQARTVLHATDILANTVLGGHYLRTISSRCGSVDRTVHRCEIICKFLDILEPGHCSGASEGEVITMKEFIKNYESYIANKAKQ